MGRVVAAVRDAGARAGQIREDLARGREIPSQFTEGDLRVIQESARRSTDRADIASSLYRHELNTFSEAEVALGRSTRTDPYSFMGLEPSVSSWGEGYDGALYQANGRTYELARGRTESNDGFWNLQLPGRRPDPGARHFKVYLGIPISRMPELMPGAVQAAERAGAFSFKFGAIPEGLLRDDRVVVYFRNEADAVRFAESMGRSLQREGVTDRPPAFTHRVGDTPVSMGADITGPNGKSWRFEVTEAIADAAVQCGRGASATCIRDRLTLSGINPDTWLPTDISDRVLARRRVRIASAEPDTSSPRSTEPRSGEVEDFDGPLTPDEQRELNATRSFPWLRNMGLDIGLAMRDVLDRVRGRPGRASGEASEGSSTAGRAGSARDEYEEMAPIPPPPSEPVVDLSFGSVMARARPEVAEVLPELRGRRVSVTLDDGTEIDGYLLRQGIDGRMIISSGNPKHAGHARRLLQQLDPSRVRQIMALEEATLEVASAPPPIPPASRRGDSGSRPRDTIELDADDLRPVGEPPPIPALARRGRVPSDAEGVIPLSGDDLRPLGEPPPIPAAAQRRRGEPPPIPAAAQRRRGEPPPIPAAAQRPVTLVRVTDPPQTRGATPPPLPVPREVLAQMRPEVAQAAQRTRGQRVSVRVQGRATPIEGYLIADANMPRRVWISSTPDMEEASGGLLGTRPVQASDIIDIRQASNTVRFSDGTVRSFDGANRFVQIPWQGRTEFAEVIDVQDSSGRVRARILDPEGQLRFVPIELTPSLLRASVAAPEAAAPFRDVASALELMDMPSAERQRLVGPEDLPEAERAQSISRTPLPPPPERPGARSLASRAAEASIAAGVDAWLRPRPEPMTDTTPFESPSRTALSLGMEIELFDEGADPNRLLVTRLGETRFVRMRGDRAFRAQLSPDRLPRGERRPQVYLPVPVRQLRALLPEVLAQARRSGAHQIEIGAELEALQGDDRLVVSFSRESDAADFARQISDFLAQRGTTGRPPAFTHPVGRGPVGLSFDSPLVSWRNEVASAIREGQARCGSSDSCVARELFERGIDPVTWLPVNRRDRVRQALGEGERPIPPPVPRAR